MGGNDEKTTDIYVGVPLCGCNGCRFAGLGGKGEARRNFETGIWTSTPELVDRLNMLFDRIWYGEACEGCGRKAVCPVPLEEFEG